MALPGYMPSQCLLFEGHVLHRTGPYEVPSRLLLASPTEKRAVVKTKF